MPNTASASVLPCTWAMPQSSRVIVTACAWRSQRDCSGVVAVAVCSRLHASSAAMTSTVDALCARAMPPRMRVFICCPLMTDRSAQRSPFRPHRAVARSAAETLAQGSTVASAAGDGGTVTHGQAGVAGIQGLDLGEVVEIDEIAAVHAHETRRVQPLLDRRHGAAQRVVATVHMQVHVIARGLQPF